jgi:hypothetical protein
VAHPYNGDHCPAYCQCSILESDAGIEISRATMRGWIMQVGCLLIPVADAMRSELLAENYIQADETPIDVQTHDGHRRNHRANLWPTELRVERRGSILA